MENIFGKEDSENESEHNDVDDKYDKDNPSQNSASKDNDAMDIDNVRVKVYMLLSYNL